ncbi:MAG TPA: hypothetical protein DDX93_01405 [Smithella sp.]|nr:hypothetical protein [Smithella sp.]
MALGMTGFVCWLRRRRHHAKTHREPCAGSKKNTETKTPCAVGHEQKKIKNKMMNRSKEIASAKTPQCEDAP